MGLRRATLVAGAILLAAGLYAASPFLTSRLVGTGEAYNYSLSVADAVTQIRAGVVPPLAGQTDYAFNGRIHPLRDAPYLHYLAYAIDLATAHRLTFWQLQNASLVFSLVAAAFTCYLGLRWATGCNRPTATLLGALYVLAPPILCSAHSLNLFMTVHAAVFVPLAIAACVQGCRHPTFKHDLLLAAALAATWLAHPPVALWLTLVTATLRLLCFLGRPTVREFLNGTLAVAAGGLLASFVFVSTATLSGDLGISASNPALWPPFAALIVSNLKSVFPASLLPVTRSGGESGDLQLGYFGYGLMLLCLWQVARRGWRRTPGIGILLFAAAALLLCLVLPVPLLTTFAWKHFPPLVYQVTTEWPIQRLYLIALAVVLFAAALLSPPGGEPSPWVRAVIVTAVAAASVWTLYQAQPFIERGFQNRRPEGESVIAYRPSNFSPTVTSYAYLDTPPNYVNGVSDPSMEYRLLFGGVTETASQFSSAAVAPITTKGEIQFRDKDDIATSRLLRLQPGHRYLLSFDFLTPPIEGYLYAVGPWIHRTYSLPDAGGPKAFGMRTGESRSLTLWTDQTSPEEIQLKIAVADRTHIVHGARLATFTLRDIDQSKLLVRIDSSFPLHFRVTAPSFGYAVETPRRFIPGYAATVNGAPGRVLRSPTGAVMVALPAGECEVSLHYAGPPAARAAFWVCAASWLVLALVGATGRLDNLDPAGTAIQAVRTAGRFVSSHWLAAALLILLAGAIGFLEARSLRRRQLLDSAGPIEVTFELPYALVPQNLPLVVTGHVGEGVMVFVRLVDATHISLGADVWGQLFQTQPIEVDYSQPHRLVVSDSALLPPDNPQVQRMSKKERDYFGRTLLLELDGRQEMAQVCNTFAATPDEIYIGQAPFGSDTEPRFIGRILRVARLPIPRRAVLPSTLVATLTVRRTGESPQEREPLLSILKGPNSRVLTVRYLSAQRVRLSLYDAEGTELQGSEVGFGSDRSHALQVSYRMPQLGEADTLDVVLDGAPILAQADGSPREQVPILISGLNQTGISGIASRFTGSELAMTTTLKEHLPPTIASPSTANLIVLFPSDRPGRHEPLLTTGKTGAGDVVYVAYLDALHVQFGFDHWNGPGASSPPVLIDYKVPHEIRISMASLNPGGQTKPDPGVSLSIDGHEMINSATTHSYPAEPAQITFGQNRIGASTADPDFSGTILFLSRGGTGPADRLVEPEPGDAR